MQPQSANDWCKRVERLSRCSAVAVALIGAAVLFGWAAHLDPFKRVLPGLVAMNPITAICFISAGVALWCLQSASSHRLQLFGRILAVTVLLVGSLRLLAYIFHWHFRVDQLLFAASIFERDAGMRNQMAPNTALNFLLIGSALLLLDVRILRFRWCAQLLSITTAALALLAISGYAFQTTSFYRVTAFIPMALNTAGAFFILALGVLFARPDRGLMRVVTSHYTGAATARRLLPAAVLVPLFLSWLRFEGEQARYYDTAFGVALMAVTTMLIFTALIWWNAASLNHTDAERHRAEEALRSSAARIHQLNEDLLSRALLLEAANKELEAFSYSVSHDLRAPLRHITGFVQLLQRQSAAALEPKAQRCVNMIDESAKEMGKLIDDLLSFARMGRAEIRASAVDLEPLVREVIRDLQPESAARDVLWTIGALPLVHADRALLRQVWFNLLSNALKYTRNRPRPEIQIGYERAPNGEHICFVRDNGVGFEMAYADKLFGVFQRLHDADDFEGTGIGLANVRRIITRHGGRTWAEGKLDSGATFYFSLPAATPALNTPLPIAHAA